MPPETIDPPAPGSPGTDASTSGERTERINAVIRFAGDSGDGMQLAGTQFTDTSAVAGNDVATLPDYPAEIRAPAGTVAGVSGFQINFASESIYTPGDIVHALIGPQDRHGLGIARRVGVARNIAGNHLVCFF